VKVSEDVSEDVSDGTKNASKKTRRLKKKRTVPFYVSSAEVGESEEKGE
jgi:hypothetical protein